MTVRRLSRKLAPARGWVSTGAGTTLFRVGAGVAACAMPGTAITGRPRVVSTARIRDATILVTVPPEEGRLEHPDATYNSVYP
jgi:hypothetical protein